MPLLSWASVLLYLLFLFWPYSLAFVARTWGTFSVFAVVAVQQRCNPSGPGLVSPGEGGRTEDGPHSGPPVPDSTDMTWKQGSKVLYHHLSSFLRGLLCTVSLRSIWSHFRSHRGLVISNTQQSLLLHRTPENQVKICTNPANMPDLQITEVVGGARCQHRGGDDVGCELCTGNRASSPPPPPPSLASPGC